MVRGRRIFPYPRYWMLAAARTFHYFKADYLPPEYPHQRTKVDVDWHQIVDLLEEVDMMNEVLGKRASWVSSADYRRFHNDGHVDGGWYASLDPEYPYKEYWDEPWPEETTNPGNLNR